MLPLYDAHNHLHDAWLQPHRAQVFVDLAATGVRCAVVNGSSEGDWGEVSTLVAEAAALPQPDRLRIIPSYGVHPWDVGNRSARWLDHLRARLDADPRAGVGEIGLDRWMLDRAKPDDPRLIGLRRAPIEEQIEVFLAQLALATERDLPASIHCLDAIGPLHDALRATKLPARGFLLHSYNGSVEMVRNFAKLGAYFSFNGAFLDPRKQRLREVYAAIPADRLLVETDAPALRLPAELEKFPPFPVADGSLAGHPANLVATYEGLAEIRRTPLSALATQMEKNFHVFFAPA
ncbi:MAG: TatD family hydrolase [Opitutaceae bacterium]